MALCGGGEQSERAEELGPRMERDCAAFEAALRLPSSTGPVEGNINRLKLIKRSGYGRAGVDLLRHQPFTPPSLIAIARLNKVRRDIIYVPTSFCTRAIFKAPARMPPAFSICHRLCQAYALVSLHFTEVSRQCVPTSINITICRLKSDATSQATISIMTQPIPNAIQKARCMIARMYEI